MGRNKNLSNAKKEKNDEFYTKLKDIEKELQYYKKHFKNKIGIYDYVLSGNENKLNIRSFPDNIIIKVYEKQKGMCVKCGKHFELNEMQADHITPWSKGGHTTDDNCQLLCNDCNRRKSNK